MMEISSVTLPLHAPLPPSFSLSHPSSSLYPSPSLSLSHFMAEPLGPRVFTSLTLRPYTLTYSTDGLQQELEKV